MSCSRRKYKYTHGQDTIHDLPFMITAHEPILMSGRRRLYLVGISFSLLVCSKINKKAPIAMCEVARPRRYNYRHEFRLEVQGEQV